MHFLLRITVQESLKNTSVDKVGLPTKNLKCCKRRGDPGLLPHKIYFKPIQ